MPVSTATVTPANVQLSPMRVTFNGVDLGGTKGGVSIGVKTDLADIMFDQFGKTVIDKKVSGHGFSAKFELAETRLKDNWKVAFPHAKLITSGGNKAVYFDMQVGDSISSHAHALILHPLEAADADLSEDINAYKAVCLSASEVKYGPENQTTLQVEMIFLPDTSVSPAKFMFVGDPAIGLVAATAGVPVFTGTGNGTMTSVVAYSGFTKTETITAKVVTPVVNGGVFEVHGSVSGPMGLATVGVSFVAPGGQISFTINDGASDFVLNDQFTIATVAANYA